MTTGKYKPRESDGLIERRERRKRRKKEREGEGRRRENKH
jgi:hypothetical protein